MSEYRRSSRPMPYSEEYAWEDCRRRPDPRPMPCCDEPCHKSCQRPIPRPTPCCDEPCFEPCQRPIPRPNPCYDEPCFEPCQRPIPRPNPCCDEPCFEPCQRPILRPNPCCDEPCCKSCQRPTSRPNPCCEFENVYSPCRPTPNFCDRPYPCNQEQINLYTTCDRQPCDCDTSCGGSIAHELRRLVGKKVMIYLERKQGPVCILGVDEHCIKALVIGSGKIIYINIDSIVSFKEIC